jgi:uncharacterized protein
LTPLASAGLTVFIVLLLVSLYTTLLGFPGTVVILLGAIIYALVTGFTSLGLGALAILFLLSVLAEALDFGLGMADIPRFVISPKGLVYSLLGAAAGVLILSPLFLGPGAILGVFLGAFTGVITTELIRQHQMKPVMRASYREIIGRASGVFIKGFLALIMITVTLANIYS